MKKQTTRMIRCDCEKCGYVCRTSSLWLERQGPPICPCNGVPMFSEGYATVQADTVKAGVLKDKQVISNKVHVCAICGDEIRPNETYRRYVYTCENEFTSEAQCGGCTGRQREYRGVL